jgi:hypothetical protein
MDVDKTKVRRIIVQPSTVQNMTYQKNLKNGKYLKKKYEYM